jgi:hypothetical protein
MGWVRVSDDFYDHERFADVGPLGMSVWLVGLAYCNRNLTDGRIPRAAAYRLLHFGGIGILEGNYGGHDASIQDGIAELVEAGLWIEDRRGYNVRDYLDYQPSRDQVEEKRKHNAFRQSQFKARKRRGLSTDGEVTA